MKKLLLTLVALLFGANLSYSAVPDSCLKLAIPHDGLDYCNPDSVHIDSCYDSPTYKKFYANRHYFLNFVENYYPYDDVLYGDEIRTVDEITNSRPELKAKFQEFEARYGKIYFKGLEWDTVGSDVDEILGSAVVRVVFEKYQLIEEIETAFRNEIDSLEERGAFFSDYPRIMIGVKEILKESGSIIIFPNPADNVLELQIDDKDRLENITIYNSMGEKVLESEYQIKLDVSELNSGIYFLKIGNKVQKFIKQ